ncbi:hypothetical protein D9M68_485570 [compost metagenome]
MSTDVGGVVESQASLTAVVHARSPPPLRFAMLVPLFRPAAGVLTLTGILISKVPGATPAATLQKTPPPIVGHPTSVPVVVPGISVGPPRRFMPAGKKSVSPMGAVVVPLATVMNRE